MIRIGLTGGIGSGKSCVAVILRSKGIPVFDCDTTAKNLMSSDTVRRRLKKATGIDFFPENVLDKSLLGSFVFSNPANAKLVNDVIHPMVRDKFRDWCVCMDGDGVTLCAVESAILLESGMRGDVDFLVVVDAPQDVRLRRVMERDNISRDDVESRMRAQMRQEDKLKEADYVILNDGDEEKLLSMTYKMIEAVRKN